MASGDMVFDSQRAKNSFGGGPGKDSQVKKNRLLIFDMDGVLIDVSSSYRETVRRVIAIFFERFLGVESFKKDTIGLQEVADIKTLGGLNNDWDLTLSILNSILFYITGGRKFYLEKVKGQGSGWCWKNDAGKLVKKPTINEDLLGDLTFRGKEGIFVDIYRRWKEKGGGVYVRGDGEVLGGDIVKRIFQEVYLGEDLFKKHYGVSSEYYTGYGLIDRETLIPDPHIVFNLSHNCHLAIVTGRPRDEAIYPLEKFRIYEVFECIITEDDIQEAGGTHLRKPDPFSILKCIECFPSISSGDIYYIGDMPDDMIAAKRAGVIPIGFVNAGAGYSEEKNIEGSESNNIKEDLYRDINMIDKHIDRLYKSGARQVFTDFSEILKLLK